MPAPSRVLAQDQAHVFSGPQKIKWELESGWVDLYALLAVVRGANRREIEDAIIARGADVLVFSFARGGDSALVKALDRYAPDFRPILLHAPSRAAYDQQLSWHESGDRRAQDYSTWRAEILALSKAARLGQSLQHAGQNWKERLARNWHESEYL